MDTVHDLAVVSRETMVDLMVALGHIDPDSTQEQINMAFWDRYMQNPARYNELAQGVVALVVEHERSWYEAVS